MGGYKTNHEIGEFIKSEGKRKWIQIKKILHVYCVYTLYENQALVG